MSFQLLRSFVCMRGLLPVLAITALACPADAFAKIPVEKNPVKLASEQAIPSSVLTISGQGMAPNQVVTLATGSTQRFTATADSNGIATFKNLKYTPTEKLAFSLSYQVKGYTAQPVPNSILINLDPFTGSVDVKGNATRAASVIVNVSAEDSETMVANNQGYFAGAASALNGLSDGVVQVVASIINVEESCCPRTMKPFAPVKITITGQPAKKAAMDIIQSTQTASISMEVPAQSYGAVVSVPSKLIEDSWVNGFNNFASRVVEALQAETTSLGTFLEAQNNIDTMRSLQQRQAKAAKTYMPSEQLCRFGSLGQSLAASDALITMNKLSLTKALQDEEMGVGTDAKTGANKRKVTLDRIWSRYCDPNDMNGALRRSCKANKNDTTYNKDIDYTSGMDVPMTLDANFSSSTGEAQDIIALGQNLFPAEPITQAPGTAGYDGAESKFRSSQAIRSVAKNSFATLAAEKAEGSAGSGLYIKKLVKALGVSEKEAGNLMGENPSYFAQMEVLTKKLYQEPSFYINLIDTPANVARQRAAIRAVKLQQQNDFAKVVKRREMLLAVLLELKLRENAKLVNSRIKTD